ncbi:MAG TPA: DUF2065 domain-containing protein [Leucothrix sp.]|nr:DUF2065 domain-containing protein [Leucothrix sp.]
MNWHDLLTAFALLLILEGLLPFASPDSIKKVYKTMVETPESSLRMMGLASIVAGLVLLYFV